jgi:NAD(P)H-dependent flavin oxidoreductase YrpB (nitropropane dioxygenase family)
MSNVFQSRYPILEACMNKGSTLELAIAVFKAGGYPSLCSWTYNGKSNLMQRDLDRFVQATGSNRIHLSFELYEYSNAEVLDIIKSYHIPTIEIIFGEKSTFRQEKSQQQTTKDLVSLLDPVKALNTKVFQRIYETVNQENMNKHLIDGFCIKGAESAGFSSYIPIKETFLKQRELTPSALLIPYGGIGTSDQVKEYINLGAEMVAVGTVLALSMESSMAPETKLALLQKQSKDLIQFKHVIGDTERKQNAIQFAPYQEPDDANRTMGLVFGLRGKNKGHVYLGKGIDHISEILPCQDIIQNLVSKLDLN